MKIVIGLDFGSDSVRALVVNAEDGQEISEGCGCYQLWKEQRYCNAEQQIFRHHPSDYISAMTEAVSTAVAHLTDEQRRQVLAIGVDATGSTVCPVDGVGNPLALSSNFEHEPDAMFHLWKDHSAAEEANEINDVFANWNGINYLSYQGQYSAEWFWAKALHTARKNAAVKEQTASWVELADWIPAELTGRKDPKIMYRCACAAGHKALWTSDFAGLPDMACLNSLDASLVRTAQNYANQPGFSVDMVGELTSDWCERFHLPRGVKVSGSSLDAHAGAVGAGICPGTLVKVIGTSTVDMAVSTKSAIAGKNMANICGMAENSILPGYVGLEAGQAAFGDIFAWFASLLLWSTDETSHIDEKTKALIHAELLAKLEKTLSLEDSPCEPVALDWFNGRRYPNNDDSIRSSMMGLSLGTTAPKLYRSLILGAVMGSKSIFDGLVNAGAEVNHVIAVGGITHKSPYTMQLMADALNRSVSVSKSLQTCALGAAMYAAVASGCYSSLQEAQQHMNRGFLCEYTPDLRNHERLEKYDLAYQQLAKMTNDWYR